MKSIKEMFKALKEAFAYAQTHNDDTDIGFMLIEKGKKFTLERKNQDAYDCFNKAIELGVKNYYVYAMRAGALSSLNRNIEAISDYDMAISMYPNKADLYHGRSISKSLINDKEGCILDLKDAIRFSKEDNENNRWWNNYAKETKGVNTATEVYEEELADEIEYMETKAKLKKISDYKNE